MSATSPTAGRLATLEMLRGAASVAVVFHHIAQQTQGDALAGSAAGRLLLWLGGWGVMVFFVLSGFCIHGSVLRAAHPGRQEPDWRNYFTRRAHRILPGYLVALALSALLGCFGDSALITRPRWIDIIAHLTFTSGFSHDTALRLNSVLWTVVVEVQFYLAYPVFVWCRNRFGIVCLTIALLAVSMSIKLGGRLWLDESARWTWHHSFLNLWWIWSMGALLAEKHAEWSAAPRRARLVHHRLPGALIVIGSLALGCFDGRRQPTVWLVVESYVLPMLAAAVVAVMVFPPLAGLRSKVGGHFGMVSYSMYLLHPVALWLVIQWMPSSPLFITVPAMMALAWLLALAGYRFVERPFLRR